MTKPRTGLRVLIPYRWMAAIALLIAVDICTILALAPSGAQSLSFSHQDKVAHFFGFFVLTVLGHLTLHFDLFPKAVRGRIWLTILNIAIWLGYGLLLEVLQGLSSYREASVADFIADAAGVFAATLFATRFFRGDKPKHE